MTSIGELDLPERSVLAAAPDAKFDHMARLTTQVLGVPTATVALVDRNGQIYPGVAGVPDALERDRAMPLSYSICKFVIAGSAPLVVADARTDARLADHPAVTELGVVAYAGMPLHDSEGRVVGTLCAIVDQPHAWTEHELAVLRALADACSAELQVRELAERAAVERERLRIAHDLHSEVFTDLLTVSMLLEEEPSPVAAAARASVGAVLKNIGSTVFGRAAGPARP